MDTSKQNSTAFLLSQAIECFESDQYELSVYYFQILESQLPEDNILIPDITYIKAVCYKHLNKYSDARRYIEHYIQTNPDSIKARKLLNEIDFIINRNKVLRRIEIKPAIEQLNNTISKCSKENTDDHWLSCVKKTLNTILADINTYCASQYAEYQVHKAPWSGGYFIEKEKQIAQYLQSLKTGYDYFDNCFGFGFDERVVEIPWVVNELMSHNVILDAGSALNHPYILKHLKLKKMYIATLYPEKYHDSSGINYVYEDLRSLPFKNNIFDAVASISTIEHIGMECSIYKYDDNLRDRDIANGDYIDAILEMKRVTKTGGNMYISAPFGKNAIYHNSFRQFDHEMVMNIVERTKPTQYDVKYFAYTTNGWILSPHEQCKEFSYRENNSPGAGSVFLLTMTA